MNKILLFLLIVTSYNLLIAQTTAIPDPNFEQALINLGYDTAPINGSVPTANINTVTSLFVEWQNISDLTGIEDFTALNNLNCSFNQLNSLNVTQNTGLTLLNCSDNQLTSIDVTQNTALTGLQFSNNQLTTIDITQNTALVNFYGEHNMLTNLDVTFNNNLELLSCYVNQLTSLDVTNNTALKSLWCQYNQLSSLDVTQNTALFGFVCSDNQLTSLDVSYNTDLISFSCDNNQLTSLNVSQNTVLKFLNCQNNQLSCLNVRNFNNINFGWFYASNNPTLTCIEVDDVAYSTTNWTNIDAGVSFSTNCGNPCSVGINEHNFSNFSIFPNPTSENITIDLGGVKQNIKATLTNSVGQVLLTQQFESTDIINMDIDAPIGIYFLQLETTEGEIKTLKVLKE